MECNSCLRYQDCMERRGICTDYDTPELRRERVGRQIESLSEKNKNRGPAERAGTDKTCKDRQAEWSDR